MAGAVSQAERRGAMERRDEQRVIASTIASQRGHMEEDPSLRVAVRHFSALLATW